VTVAAFEYNGLGHRIGHQWDYDADTDLDWQWLVYDDKWRVIARFQDGAAVNAPFEQVYHHHAGLAGYGGSSYIDLVIARDRDTNTGSAGFETREYVLQNWRADVVALVAPATYGDGGALVEAGRLIERVTYDAYGIPFATHPTDLTKGAIAATAGYGMPDGVLNNDDYSYFLILYGNTDPRADWNKDGTLSAADSTAFLADYGAASGSWGRGVLSNRQNILGYAGYVHEPATGSAGVGHGTMYHCRLRVHHAGLGRWIQRDPPQFEYGEGMSLYWYGAASPIVMVDWLGGPPGCGGRVICGIAWPPRRFFLPPWHDWDLGDCETEYTSADCEDLCRPGPGNPIGPQGQTPMPDQDFCCVCLGNIRNIIPDQWDELTPPGTPPPPPINWDNPLFQVIAECTAKHEERHVQDPIKNQVPPLDNPSCYHVLAYSDELACLEAARGDVGPPWDAFLEGYINLIRESIDQMCDHCATSGGTPPPECDPYLP
jgi:RHS repeat-associated protein